MILVMILASFLVEIGDNTVPTEGPPLGDPAGTPNPDTKSQDTEPICSDKAIRMEENVTWFDDPFKDLYGNPDNSPPLPFMIPFSRNVSGEINMQINRELFAHYTYLSMAMHFDRDDIDLPGFYKFFKESAEEEMEHAQRLMKYQNMRGGRVKLQQVMTPCKDEWGDGLQAMQDALKLEKEEYKSLLRLHEAAHGSDDPQLQDFLEAEFLGEQVKSIKQLSNHINILKRLNETNYNLGEYQFDKLTLDGSKE